MTRVVGASNVVVVVVGSRVVLGETDVGAATMGTDVVAGDSTDVEAANDVTVEVDAVPDVDVDANWSSENVAGAVSGWGITTQNAATATVTPINATTPGRPRAQVALKRIGSSTSRFDTAAAANEVTNLKPNRGQPDMPVRCCDSKAYIGQCHRYRLYDSTPVIRSGAQPIQRVTAASGRRSAPGDQQPGQQRMDEQPTAEDPRRARPVDEDPEQTDRDGKARGEHGVRPGQSRGEPDRRLSQRCGGEQRAEQQAARPRVGADVHPRRIGRIEQA